MAFPNLMRMVEEMAAQQNDEGALSVALRLGRELEVKSIVRFDRAQFNLLIKPRGPPKSDSEAREFFQEREWRVKLLVERVMRGLLAELEKQETGK